MNILLVSATKPEVSPLLDKFKRNSKNSFYTYSVGKHSANVLITGVGMTATAFYLAKALHRKYHLAINAGVAGSFKRNLAPGTVLNVKSDCFADLGAEDGKKFLTLDEMGLTQAPDSMFQARGLKHTGLPARMKQIIDTLPQANAITVNTVHGNTASIRKVANKFNPDIESMEGAAFFFACAHFRTPCIQVRAVSNYVERRNKENWKLGLAIKNLTAFLEQLLCSS